MRKKVIIVGGVGAGDEGKGSIVEDLTRRYNAEVILRYNGGSQALHHVVMPDGMVHGFRQFGAGTLASPKVRTYLSRFMVVDPFFLYEEANELINKGLEYSQGQVIVDRDCIVVTPFHRIINQMLEMSRHDKRLGSCGRGIGEALKDWSNSGRDVLLAGDLIDKQKTLYKLRHLLISKIDLAEQLVYECPYIFGLTLKLRAKLNELRGYSSWLDRLAQNYCDLFKFDFFKYGDPKILKRLLGKTETVIFEGAQGALLDPCFGFVPYVTKTRTNFDNADEILGDAAYDGDVIKIGVMRAYSTRHGMGPFVTEDLGLFPCMLEDHNDWNEWQGKFRIGWTDLVATKYALDIMRKVNYLAVTNLDRFIYLHKMRGRSNIRICNSYTTNVAKSNSSLNAFFEFKENGKSRTIKRIKIPEDPKLDRSELTRLLYRCRPVYESLPGLGEQAYIDFLEEQLGVKVAILSRGPTYKDKVEILSPC